MTDDTDDLNALFEKGGNIQLLPKTYFVSRDVTVGIEGTRLSGTGQTVIVKTQGCQILVAANSCFVAGIRIDGNQFAGSGFVVMGSLNSIVNCQSENNGIGANQLGGSGIVVAGSYNSIVSCRSENNAGHGFSLGGDHLSPGSDLASNDCKFNEIKNCFAIRNGGIGISQYHHWDGRILENSCFDNGNEGITIDVWSLRNLVMGNSLQNNCRKGGVGGIGVDFSDLNRIAANFIEQRADFPGITLQNNIGQSNYNILSHNIIVNPLHGIVLKANIRSPVIGDEPLQTAPRTSNHNMVIDNLIRGAVNKDNSGVLVEAGCSDNEIRGNKLT